MHCLKLLSENLSVFKWKADYLIDENFKKLNISSQVCLFVEDHFSFYRDI